MDVNLVDAQSYFWTRDAVWKRYSTLLENQNKVIEQFLVPSV
ncbi:MAG: hypothetical protein QM784_09295 [Polyangiaceae bacterium]